MSQIRQQPLGNDLFGSAALLQRYFSANEQYFCLTTNQRKHQHEPNFSEQNEKKILKRRPLYPSAIHTKHLENGENLTWGRRVMGG